MLLAENSRTVQKMKALLVAGMEVSLEVNAEKVVLYFHVSSKRMRDIIIT